MIEKQWGFMLELHLSFSATNEFSAESENSFSILQLFSYHVMVPDVTTLLSFIWFSNIFFYRVLLGLSCVPHTSYVETLIRNVSVFGGRIYREVMKVNEVIRMGTQNSRTRTSSLSTMWKHNEKVPVCKPGRKFSPETEACWILIWKFLAFRMLSKLISFFLSYPAYVILLSLALKG